MTDPHLPDTSAITALLLAGGRGSRMGGVDKGLQNYHGTPLALHALMRLQQQTLAPSEVMINANRNLAAYESFGRFAGSHPKPRQKARLSFACSCRQNAIESGAACARHHWAEGRFHNESRRRVLNSGSGTLQPQAASRNPASGCADLSHGPFHASHGHSRPSR